MMGFFGYRGIKGDWGELGLKGDVGIFGSWGIWGIMGGLGFRGEKGEKGGFGEMGILGFFGIFGWMVFVLEVILLLVIVIIDEGGSMIFNCIVGGNLVLKVIWKFEGNILWIGLKYVIDKGLLIINELKFNDIGFYFCVVVSVLGFDEVFVNFMVRGKVIFINYFF